MEQDTEAVQAKDIKPGDIIQYSSRDVVTFKQGDLIRPLEGEVIHIFAEQMQLIFKTASGCLKSCSRNKKFTRVAKTERTREEQLTMRSHGGSTLVKTGKRWVSID